jgi:ABC-type sugar transport system substrate-binding protein
MQETKPPNIHVTLLKGQWTQESALRTVRSWLQLSTSQKAPIDLVGAQNDAMAIGARRAFQELTNETERERWLHLPYTGVDGLPKTGQVWVRSGLLSATILTPANAGQGLELLVQGIRQQKQPPTRILVQPISIPAIEALSVKR